MKKILFLIFVFSFISGSVFFFVFGPYKVKKIDGKIVYFEGRSIEGLNTGNRYRFFAILSKGAPTSLVDVKPMGKVKIHYLTETGGILTFPHPVSGKLKLNSRFLLIRGRKLLFNSAIRKVAEKEKRLMLLDLTATEVYYTPDINCFHFKTSFQFIRLLSSVGFQFKVGLLNINSIQAKEIYNGNGNTTKTEYNVNYTSGYLSMMVGISEERIALMIGPILGVTNGQNAYGFDSLLRYGEIGGSYFQFNLTTLPESLWVEAGFEFRVDVDLNPGGSGIVGEYKPSSVPSLEDGLNNQILFGYSYTKEKSNFNILGGYSMSGTSKRGPAFEVSWGFVF